MMTYFLTHQCVIRHQCVNVVNKMADMHMHLSWWRHQMETVTGEFPAQRQVTQSFDVFFDLRLNKRLGKQSWGWWFEMPPRPLRRHMKNIIFWFKFHSGPLNAQLTKFVIGLVPIWHQTITWNPVLQRIQTSCTGLLARYVKFWVARVPGMPGTFSLPLTSNETR